MNVAEDVARRVAAIAGDRERGATELARVALDVLQWAAEHAATEMAQTVAALGRARPAMPAIKNAVSRVVADPAVTTNPRAAASACRAARAWLDEASRLAIEQAAAVMPAGALVVTCSYSSAVVQACLLAATQRRLRVRAVESRAGDVAYGERVAARLTTQHVACDVVPDERLTEALTGATLVLVGADCVRPDGALANGSPSLRLAVAAHDRGVPFYAVCETFKLDDECALEPGLDLVPPHIVTGYITAGGVAPPGEVWIRGRLT
jgi:translation initiation factor 2B subunit (eIF-2B alpha/beta/delta family)